VTTPNEYKNPLGTVLFIIVAVCFVGLMVLNELGISQGKEFFGPLAAHLDQAQGRTALRQYTVDAFNPKKKQPIGQIQKAGAELLRAAEKSYQQALQDQPDNSQLRFDLALCQLQLGRFAFAAMTLPESSPATDLPQETYSALRALLFEPRPAPGLLDKPGVRKFIDASDGSHIWLASIYTRLDRPDEAIRQQEIAYRTALPFVTTYTGVISAWVILGFIGLIALVSILINPKPAAPVAAVPPQTTAIDETADTGTAISENTVAPQSPFTSGVIRIPATPINPPEPSPSPEPSPLPIPEPSVSDSPYSPPVYQLSGPVLPRPPQRILTLSLASETFFIWLFLQFVFQSIIGIAAVIPFFIRVVSQGQGGASDLERLISDLGAASLTPGVIAASTVANAVATLICLVWLRFRTRRGFVLGWRMHPVWLQLRYALALFCFGSLCVLIGSLIETKTGHTSQEPSVLLLAQAQSLPLRIFILFVACTVVPFYEETIFRGILFRGLRTQWGVTVAILLSAALFAAAHADLLAAVPIFLFAIALAWSVQRTDSIIPGVIAHGLFNMFSLVVMNITTMR
jgi:uncharacterized protein